jgi:Meckel syndrome type 1 protein
MTAIPVGAGRLPAGGAAAMSAAVAAQVSGAPSVSDAVAAQAYGAQGATGAVVVQVGGVRGTSRAVASQVGGFQGVPGAVQPQVGDAQVAAAANAQPAAPLHAMTTEGSHAGAQAPRSVSTPSASVAPPGNHAPPATSSASAPAAQPLAESTLAASASFAAAASPGAGHVTTPDTPSAADFAATAAAARTVTVTGTVTGTAVPGVGAGAAAPAPAALAPIERALLDALPRDPAPRLTAAFDGRSVQVWLGIDGAADVGALLRTVQRVLREHGLELSALTCNGRTVYRARIDAASASTAIHWEE